MNEHLHELVAAIALLFALLVGLTHESAPVGDPSFDPSTATLYVNTEEP